jgi:hypothetical protein
MTRATVAPAPPTLTGVSNWATALPTYQALRDFGLSLGALALARLSADYGRPIH